ncbi:hypothetical protein BH24BAC1_BH24BAC1_24170 [soil metagenome]
MEPRIPFEPETFYHVYHHGNAEENLFRTEENYHYFLKKYAEYIYPVAATYAYCLMPNHFHLLIRVRPEEELRAFFSSLGKALPGFQTLEGLVSRQFSHWLNGYTQAFNKMYNRKGSLFLKSLRRKAIRDDHYFTQGIRYIHYNPVHHRFVQDLNDWPHSSYQALLSRRPTKLPREEVMAWFGDRTGFLESHQFDPVIPLDFED